MKFFPLIWAGLWRKRSRTVLTLLSITIAFLLFGLLQGLNTSFANIAKATHVNRLYVSSRVAIGEPLPIAYRDQIAAIAGVRAVAPLGSFTGYFQEPRKVVPAYVVDPIAFLHAFPEIVASPEAVRAMAETRTGAIIGDGMAKRLGWKVGDRVPIISSIMRTDGTSQWPVDIVGIMSSTERPAYGQIALVNYDYINEGRSALSGKDKVIFFVVNVEDPGRALEVARAIDHQFLNSEYETRTQTEAEIGAMQLKQLGDINFFVTAVMGGVFFTLLFLTGNTMAQSVHERIAELGVLKTIGFGNRALLAMILAEAGLLCLLGAAIGMGLSAFAFPLMKQALFFVKFSPEVVAAGVATAAFLAVISGASPGLRASRLEIVEALANK